MTSQDGSSVRFEWGAVGAEAVALGPRPAPCTVVVDVLSFTTCVSVAVDRGTAVHPYRWRDRTAQQYAEQRGAVLARARGEPGGPSLSPASIAAGPWVERLVLPSPNGSTIAHLLAAGGTTVVAACLRNRRAVARFAAALALGRPVAVVAAGERWPDGSLRPAVEDLWGAGALIDALADLGVGDLSPEAASAAAAFREVGGALGPALLAASSGVELVGRGYADDVRIAAELDVSDRVPVLRDGAFTAAATGREAL